MGGRVVQLKEGKEKVVERDDPLGLAEQWSLFGDLAVIDLDAAMGKGENLELVKALCRVGPCRVGGGIRTEERARELIKAGARQLIIGTAASPDFLTQFPKEWLVVALDARRGKRLTHGWQVATGESPAAAAGRLGPYCAGFLFTVVEKEGLMQGTDLEQIRMIRQATDLPLAVAGGITTIEEVRALAEMGVDVQLGMALYTGRLRLADAVLASINFDKGLIPTIVEDEREQLLMVAFSSRESLERALTTRQGWYYSRSRQSLWRKGETSEHTQALVRVRYDCDRDTVRFTVRQVGPACHTGQPTCFGQPTPRPLDHLMTVLAQRMSRPRSSSYSSQLMADPKALAEKIREESAELAHFTGRENLVWEAADLLYAMSVLLAREGVEWAEVEAELRSRQNP